jgi:hypothetical protein
LDSGKDLVDGLLEVAKAMNGKVRPSIMRMFLRMLEAVEGTDEVDAEGQDWERVDEEDMEVDLNGDGRW